MAQNPDTSNITALILAGGRGTRMGGVDKGLLELDGSPMVMHLARTLAPQVREILLSANRSHPQYRGLGFVPLPDQRADFAGPLAGIETAFAELDTPYLVVCPCDTPHIPGNYASRLFDSLGDGDACFARSDVRDHYLHLLVRRQAASTLTDYLDGGGRSVRGWLDQLDARSTVFPEAELRNINTPDALASTPPGGGS